MGIIVKKKNNFTYYTYVNASNVQNRVIFTFILCVVVTIMNNNYCAWSVWWVTRSYVGRNSKCRPFRARNIMWVMCMHGPYSLQSVCQFIIMTIVIKTKTWLLTCLRWFIFNTREGEITQISAARHEILCDTYSIKSLCFAYYRTQRNNLCLRFLRRWTLRARRSNNNGKHCQNERIIVIWEWKGVPRGNFLGNTHLENKKKIGTKTNFLRPKRSF